MKRNFFREQQLFKKQNLSISADSIKSESRECVIQVPSPEHIRQMNSMPAGGEEDQSERLMNMVHTIEQVHKLTPLPLLTTDEVSLAPEWQNLFKAIDKGNKNEALELFNLIPIDDVILQPLLEVHPQDYLKKIITNSIEAQGKGIKKLNADIILTPKTFEILIKDIAATILNPAKLNFSFGLPTHHAFSSEGSGFCILNKTEVLMRHTHATCDKPLKCVVVGTDVNRDNGLCAILREFASLMSIRHIDIFDSRVYPRQDHVFIKKEFKTEARSVGNNIKCWVQEQFEYFAVDLSLTTRKTVSVHPAPLFALNKIKESIVEAKKNGAMIALFLPTGWDSHENETAFCGKFIDGELMSESESHLARFNDGDLSYFYEQILTYYKENKDCIKEIYWGLEGGYDRFMYEKQIQSLMIGVNEQILNQDLNQNSYGR